jgi:DNA helicase-2/ATP-dependent DNA helicase PcrA
MRDIGLYDAMEMTDEIMSMGKASAKIRPFVQLIQSLRKDSADMTVAELIEEIVEKIGYADYLQDYDEENGEDRIANVDELITKAVTYQETHDEPNLTEFLAEVALVAEIDNVDSDDNRVLLMTLHSAKGLEFPNVYLAGMEDGLFPSYMSIASDDPSDLEEERRLAYVGITRAMNDLTLTCARMRMTRGETQYNPMSRFVREIPDELMDSKISAPRRRNMDEDVLPGLIGLGGSRRENAQQDFRPKALLRPKVTAKADKPFIAKGMDSLNQLAGISKGAPVQLTGELSYGVGDRVLHIKYGEGRVAALVKEPRDYKVTVDFDKAGTKIMYASFAKLKRL